MKISSSLSPREYLIAVRMRLSGHLDYNERFTGLILGSCFHVTHHAEYQWDRRYASPKNAAVGYIREADEGCEIHCFFARGMLCPAQFISLFLIYTLILIGMLAFKNLLSAVGVPLCILIGLIVTLLQGIISALFESTTERSEAGRQALLALLEDPKDPFANLR